VIREEFLLEGFPVSSPRGFLGWANALLLDDGTTRMAVDTGGPGDRGVLIQRMRSLGLDPASIDVLVLTHLHFDHCANVDLFPRARIVLARAEHAYVEGRAYVAAGDVGIFAAVLPVLEARDVRLIDEEIELIPGIRVLLTPGHTPGSLSLLYERSGVLTLACADLVKNGREFLEGPPSAGARETLARVRHLATRWIPGHDRPFLVEGDRIRYQGVRVLELELLLDPRKAPTVARWQLD
jgi:glyoxylase-like metal-dependent hydrolase (beta-lactamase superfamily II)